MLFAYQTINRINRLQITKSGRGGRATSPAQGEGSFKWWSFPHDDLNEIYYHGDNYIIHQVITTSLSSLSFSLWALQFGNCRWSSPKSRNLWEQLRDLAQSVPGLQFPALPVLAPPFWQAVRAFRFLEVPGNIWGLFHLVIMQHYCERFRTRRFHQIGTSNEV